jgi:hypothetical protein
MSGLLSDRQKDELYVAYLIDWRQADIIFSSSNTPSPSYASLARFITTDINSRS